MKKISIILLMGMASVGFAMDAEQLKEAALKACDTQLESVPENMREQSKKTCECTVKKTDYEKVLAAQKTGNTEELQADAVKIAQECALASM
ncbi:MAG: hypothetical protein R3E90_04900 [Marinicella sp.]|nr:hypothetical protein [Xanthomonadales bacterium]